MEFIKVKVTLMDGQDWTTYEADDYESCRFDFVRSGYATLCTHPDFKCVQVGCACIERIK
jgi:hypothetical protein